MELNWRFVAIFAGGAFVLSVLSAAIAGVSFGALILRALLGAAVFGGLAVLIQFVIDRFLPELSSPADAGGVSRHTARRSSAEAAGDAEDPAADYAAGATGQNVDIVVEEEAEELTGVDDDEEEEEPAELAGAGDDSDSLDDDTGGDGEPLYGAEGATENGAASEAAGTPAGQSGAGPGSPTSSGGAPAGSGGTGPYQFDSFDREDRGADEDGADELIEEVEEVTSGEEPSSESNQTAWHDKATAEVSSSDIDALPDIGGLSESFGESQEEDDRGQEHASGESSGMTDLGGGNSGSSQHRSDQDPETIARAIQTVLRRE